MIRFSKKKSLLSKVQKTFKHLWKIYLWWNSACVITERYKGTKNTGEDTKYFKHIKKSATEK